LLLYGSKRGPHQFWFGHLACGNTGRGDRIWTCGLFVPNHQRGCHQRAL